MKRQRKTRFAALTAAILISSTLSVHADLKLGELGKEPNQISSGSDSFAGSQDAVALDDLGISIIPSEYVSIRQEDDFVYIYTKETGCIPYVIVGCYDSAADDFASQFTQYMAQQYSDLQVTAPETTVTLGEREYAFVQYSYTVSGYKVRDSRLFKAANGKTYMFGAKAVPELSLYTGSSLEEIAGSFAYLAGGDSDYAKHVDSTRAVESDTQEMITNPEDTSTTTSIVFAQEKAGYKGVWVPFDDGFQLYLPADWNTYELSEEGINQGLLYAAGDTSGSDTAPAVSVVWAKNDGAENIEELASEIRQAGYPVDGIVSINGIPCVSYRIEDGDCSEIMFFHPTDQQYILCITATQYTANVDMICSILTSLSLTAS